MHCFTTAVLLFETLWFPAYRERLVFDTGETAPHCYNKDHAGNEIRACEEQVEKYVVKKREKQALLTKDHIEFVFCMSPAIRQKHEILKQRFEKEIKTAMA